MAGFLLGGVIAIPVAEYHLRQYMDGVAIQENASLDEARGLLGAMQHSAYRAVFRMPSLSDCESWCWVPILCEMPDEFSAGKSIAQQALHGRRNRSATSKQGKLCQWPTAVSSRFAMKA